MAFDAFLKLDGIDGESVDRSHPGEIEVASFSWGVSNPSSSSSGGGGGAGKATFQDFHFTMSSSKASPKLMLACATGEHIKKAVLTVRKAGLEYVKIRLDDVLVSGYDQNGEALTGDFPTDQLSLNFVKIDFLFTTKSGEQSETGFDVIRNTTG